MICPKCGGEMTKVYWERNWGWYICYHPTDNDYRMIYFRDGE